MDQDTRWGDLPTFRLAMASRQTQSVWLEGAEAMMWRLPARAAARALDSQIEQMHREIAEAMEKNRASAEEAARAGGWTATVWLALQSVVRAMADEETAGIRELPTDPIAAVVAKIMKRYEIG